MLTPSRGIAAPVLFAILLCAGCSTRTADTATDAGAVQITGPDGSLHYFRAAKDPAAVVEPAAPPASANLTAPAVPGMEFGGEVFLSSESVDARLAREQSERFVMLPQPDGVFRPTRIDAPDPAEVPAPEAAPSPVTRVLPVTPVACLPVARTIAAGQVLDGPPRRVRWPGPDGEYAGGGEAGFYIFPLRGRPSGWRFTVVQGDASQDRPAVLITDTRGTVLMAGNNPATELIPETAFRYRIIRGEYGVEALPEAATHVVVVHAVVGGLPRFCGGRPASRDAGPSTRTTLTVEEVAGTQ